MEAPDSQIRKMYNPELNAMGETTPAAYETIYAHRGWDLVEPIAAFASEVIDRPVTKVQDLTIDEARRTLAAQSIPQPPASATKDEVLAVLLDPSTAFGGTVADDVSQLATADPSSQPAPITLYDPSDHNVDGEDGVLAYLETASAGEVARVQELEASGKGRKSVLEWAPSGDS